MKHRSEPPVWTRHGLSIVPKNDAAMEMLRGFQSGELFTGTFYRKRSLRQLRLWWGLMAILVDHQVFPTKESASDAVKIACGHTDTFIMPGSGQTFFTPRSIAFESLAQSAFNPIFQAALDVVCERWCKVDRAALAREIYAAIDGPSRVGERVVK